jgi:hypothetical protein
VRRPLDRGVVVDVFASKGSLTLSQRLKNERNEERRSGHSLVCVSCFWLRGAKEDKDTEVL